MAAQCSKRSNTWDIFSGPTGTLRLWSRKTLEANPHCPAPPQSDTPQVPPPAITSQDSARVWKEHGCEDSVCKSRSTLRSALVQVKQPSEDRKMKSVVRRLWVCVCTSKKLVGPWEVLKWAQECGEETRHQPTLRPTNTKWTGRLPREMKGNYWKRRVLEALHIHQ